MTEQLAAAGGNESLGPGDPAPPSPSHWSVPSAVMVAVLTFAAMCVAVLVRSPQLLEPDDFAYRASIIALTHGHLLSLTNADYQTLLKELSNAGGQGVAQWVHTASGTWMSVVT